jgi:transcription elongation factor Elf1
MIQKAYITRNNMITFTCPECRHPRLVSLSEWPELEKAVKVKVTCRECGCKYRAIIERRAQYRKVVNFPGTYTRMVNGRAGETGYMNVIDLSRTGLKIRLSEIGPLTIGDLLLIEFRLDDAQRSLIRKEVEIKKIFNLELGVAFTSVHPSDPSDRALGFYMLC